MWFPLTARYVEELIEGEIAAGIPSDRVVVAGFSQGGAVALMALRSEHKLAGVIGELMLPYVAFSCEL